MNAYVEMFKLTKDTENFRTFRPIPTEFSPRSTRAKRYDTVFRNLHNEYSEAFKLLHYSVAKDVLPTEVPVESIGYFEGLFFTNRLFKLMYSQFIAFTKDEAIRMFKELIDWKNIVLETEFPGSFVCRSMFPETFDELQNQINAMLEKFEDGKTFIVFSW